MPTLGAYFNSVSPFGIFDQGGNVWEVLEERKGNNPNADMRMNRGHDYAGNGNDMQSNRRNYAPPNSKNNNQGFRVGRFKSGTVVRIQ